jgi:hypothetical protein
VAYHLADGETRRTGLDYSVHSLGLIGRPKPPFKSTG